MYQFRWLKRYEGHPTDDWIMVLQYRKVNGLFHEPDWIDVPIVKEKENENTNLYCC